MNTFPTISELYIAILQGICFHSTVKGLIMDRCVLLTSTPECVVSPRGETTREGVDVSNTHLSMINPNYNMMPAISVRTNQYFAY